MKPPRFVKFKYVTYRVSDGSKMEITPIPYWDNHKYENLIQMGMEKFIIETEGMFTVKNIRHDTLQHFERILSDYLPALRRLT